MQEQEITFKSGELELAGTIAFPNQDGLFPAVLFLSGGGQSDRDDNVKNYHINAFFDISHYLAENGIASLRFDKRGVGQSQGNHWKSGFYDHCQDALAALLYLRQQQHIQPQCIYLLGHSEGAFIATRLAGSGAEMAGIILIAGGAQSGEAVLKWQTVQVAKGLRGLNGWITRVFYKDIARAAQKQIDQVKRSRRDVYRRQLLVKVNAKWLREFMAYDLSQDLQRVTVPVLAVTGSKDIQVDSADLERMAGMTVAPFERHVIDGMPHMLRIEREEPSISRYKEEIRRPAEPELLNIILKWIRNEVTE